MKPVVKLFGFEAMRFQTNAVYEPAGPETLKDWITRYLGSGAQDGWNDPSLRDEKEWWTGLEKVVKEILIMDAKDESMADDIQNFAKKLQVSLNMFLMSVSQEAKVSLECLRQSRILFL